MSLGKRFDMNKKPIKTRWWLRLAIAVASPVFLILNKARVKTDKEVKKLKGPYLILSTHAAFIDFPMVAAGIFPKTTGWVISVEEFRRTDLLMRGIGGIPKRKFTHDICTVKNIIYYIKKLKRTVTIYPEARFALAGVNERLDGALGKLCKVLGVPVVMCMANGNFINSPQWSKKPYRKIRQEGHLYQLCSSEEVKTLSAEEIQDRIEKAFVRDEYKWQVENNLHIKCKQRADGLHKILYKCPVCGKEFKMNSAGINLWCEECGAKWEMDTLSRLNGVNTDKGFSHIPDWYNWEREEVRKEVRNGAYHFEDDVRIEDYYNSSKRFIVVGEGHLTHDKDGFTITGVIDGEQTTIRKPVDSMYSCHIEYNLVGRGECIDIATEKTSYFMYMKTKENRLTKIHFATEELYDFYVKEQN